MQTQKYHWPSILILASVIPGAGLFLVAALGFAANAVITLIGHGDDPAGSMIAAAAAAFQGIFLAVLAWLVLQKARGLPAADLPASHPFIAWQSLFGFALAAAALGLGAAVSYTKSPILSTLILPALAILVIVPPIWVLSGWGAHGSPLGPRWRVAGIIGLGMTLGPLIMLTLELLFAVVLAAMGAVAVASQPGLIREFLRVAPTLDLQGDPQGLLNLVGPLLLKPGVIAAVLAYIGFLVPMLEELFKPVGVWLFARAIDTPQQGFALGILSGAAYSLVEGLGVSGRGGPDWALTVGVRAGTSLLHITTAGLMGSAIVAAFRHRRLAGLLATYALAVVIHGLWNASAAAVAFAALADSLGRSGWLIPVSVAAVGGLSVLVAGLPVVLIGSNRRLAASASAISSDATAMSGSSREE